jgi:hypothetical protein
MARAQHVTRDVSHATPVTTWCVALLRLRFVLQAATSVCSIRIMRLLRCKLACAYRHVLAQSVHVSPRTRCVNTYYRCCNSLHSNTATIDVITATTPSLIPHHHPHHQPALSSPKSQSYFVTL